MRARITPKPTVANPSFEPNPNMHKFGLFGDYIVIDPNSGSVHVADKQAYELLDKVSPEYFDKYEGIEGGCYSELRSLYKDGLLFSEDDCEKYAETSIDAPLKALCLQVSHDCNLRCEYCFADEGAYGGERSTMTPETAVKAIDFLVKNSGERTELEMDFFGGEPLMAFETIKAAVNYARKNEKKWNKHFRFTVTTNGLLLDDEKISFINNNMSNCVISLDGRKEINDKVRYTENKRGSFDLIIDKFKSLVKKREENNNPDFSDWYIRGTFTAYNLDFSEDVIEMARLGFKNISIEPVTADDNKPYAIKREHLPLIFKQYERLYSLIKSGELDINFFHFNVDLTGGPCVIRRLRGCGCGNEYLAVSPTGKVYPCHRFTGDDDYIMGDIKEDKPSSLNPEIKSYFTKTHIYSKSDCKNCWARFYCSGGCNASSNDNYGDCRKTDSNSIECLMMKKRLECAIALAALK